MSFKTGCHKFNTHCVPVIAGASFSSSDARRSSGDDVALNEAFCIYLYRKNASVLFCAYSQIDHNYRYDLFTKLHTLPCYVGVCCRLSQFRVI